MNPEEIYEQLESCKANLKRLLNEKKPPSYLALHTVMDNITYIMEEMKEANP